MELRVVAADERVARRRGRRRRRGPLAPLRRRRWPSASTLPTALRQVLPVVVTRAPGAPRRAAAGSDAAAAAVAAADVARDQRAVHSGAEEAGGLLNADNSWYGDVSTRTSSCRGRAASPASAAGGAFTTCHRATRTPTCRPTLTALTTRMAAQATAAARRTMATAAGGSRRSRGGGGGAPAAVHVDGPRGLSVAHLPHVLLVRRRRRPAPRCASRFSTTTRRSSRSRPTR